jgi:hypothetical protein
MKPLKTKVFQRIKEVQLEGISQCLLEFSKNGKLLGIYDKKQETLIVYNSSNILECMKFIEHKKHIFKLKIPFDDNEQEIERIVFDLRDKYLALVSKTQIRVVTIHKKQASCDFVYTIPEQYDGILDLVIDSQNAGVHNF